LDSNSRPHSQMRRLASNVIATVWSLGTHPRAPSSGWD